VYFLEQLRKKFPAHKSSFRQKKDAGTLLTATYRNAAEILALMHCLFELQRIRSFFLVYTHAKTEKNPRTSDTTVTKLSFLALFSMGQIQRTYTLIELSTLTSRYKTLPIRIPGHTC